MKKTKLIIAIIFISLLSLFLSITFSKVSANGVFYYADTFDTELMTITPNVNEYGINGLGLKTKYNNANAKLKNKICGDFELDFSFFNENDFVYLKELEIELFDDNGKGFSIIIENNLSEISTCLSFYGSKYGLSYVGNNLENKTASNNLAGIYTKLPSSNYYKVNYEKESGNVYISSGDIKRLVWCINSDTNDGAESKTYSFDNSYHMRFKYNSIAFPQEKYGKNYAGIIIYSINGQSYNGISIQNTTGPKVYTSIVDRPIAGINYYLPKPVACDAIDGNINNVYIEVKSGADTIISKTLYTDGLYFVPENGAKYNIKYSASDSKTLVGVYQKEVETTIAQFNGKFIYSNYIGDDSFGVGSNIFIPSVYAVSDTFINKLNRDVSLEIIYNDSTLKKYNNVSDVLDNNFIFDKAGNYSFMFSSQNENHQINETFNFSVDENKETIIIDGAVKSEYNSENEILFPDMVFKLGNKSIKAQKFITFPNKSKYEAKNEVLLNDEGWYTIEYSATLDGKTYSKTIPFKIVVSPLGYVGGVEHYNSVINNEEKLVLNFYSSEQKVFTNGVVDLNDFSSKESFIEIEFMPIDEDVLDFRWIYVTLTDVEDPSVYVTITLCCTYEGANSNKVYAGAKNNKASYYTGVHRDFGTDQEVIYHNIWGARTLIDPGKSGQIIKLSYDISTNIVYINYTVDSNPNLPIVDLDNLRYVDEIWDGFPSGKVKIDVTVSEINTSKAVFSLRKLGKSGFEDDDYCNIKVNTDLAEYPNAKVGEKFMLFDAVATNSRGLELPVDVSIVFADNQNIQFATDGKSFVPPSEGKYYVVYSAKTMNGETIEKKMLVEAVNSIPDLTISAVFNDTVYVGDLIVIPDCQVSGALGPVTISKYIEYNGVKTQIETDYLPLVDGEYAIVYEAVDFNERKATLRIPFDVLCDEQPVFINPVFNIDYMLCGEEYTLPIVKAYDSGSKSMIDASISIVDGGSITELSNNVFKPEYNDSKEIIVRYTAQGQSTTNSIDYTVKVVKIENNKKYYANRLFTGKNIEVNWESNGIVISSLVDAKARFVNPIMKNFNMSFIVNNANFTRLNIYLTDSLDENNVLKISYEIKGDKIIVRINGTERVYNSLTGTFDGNTVFDIIYNDGQKTISNNAKQFQHNVKLNLNGGDFHGFKGNTVYVDLEFEGVSGSSSVTVVYLNNQSFRNQIVNGMITDMFKPQILLLSDYGGSYSYNSLLVTQKAMAIDVLSGYTNCTLSVTHSSKNGVKTTDGQLLIDLPADKEYEICLSEYGSYLFEYYAKDAIGNEEIFTYIVKIQDRTAPEITLKEEIKSSIKVGSKIKVVDASLKDNVSDSSNIVLYITLTEYNGSTRIIHVGDEIVLNKIGRYIITYLAYDEACNVSIESFEIEVY